MLPIGGLARFELNKPPNFDNVKEGARGIIYRMSLVVMVKGVLTEVCVRLASFLREGVGVRLP